MRLWLIPPLLLAGCASPNYATTPTNQLCMSYLTYPSYNVHQPARAAELARRGESCQAYAGAAAVRQQANQEANRMIQDAARAAQPVQPNVHTYVAPNGRTVTCVNHGNVTTCN